MLFFFAERERKGLILLRHLNINNKRGIFFFLLIGIVMGSCSSIQQITIDLHQQNSIHFTDEILSGFVHWTNRNDKIRTREISISLIGEIGYTTTKTLSNGRGGSTTLTEYRHSPFYSSKMIFIRPKIGDEFVVLSQGHYSWPFQFDLFDILPPSINSPQVYPHVRYFLQVIIDKPRFQFNQKQIRFLTIYPRVTLDNHYEYFQQATFATQNRKDILLRGKINKIGFLPGESIDFQIEIDNPKEILIKNVRFIIFQSSIIDINHYRQVIFQTNLPTIQNCKLKQIREEFFVTLPDKDQISPSFHYQRNTSTPSFILNRYFIKLIVQVQGFLTNFDISLPIFIGTKPKIDDDDLPPSYESVLQNK